MLKIYKIKNNKSSSIYDHLLVIFLALVLILTLMLVFPSIAEGFDKALDWLRGLR